jgi:hypothetical protein
MANHGAISRNALASGCQQNDRKPGANALRRMANGGLTDPIKTLSVNQGHAVFANVCIAN